MSRRGWLVLCWSLVVCLPGRGAAQAPSAAALAQVRRVEQATRVVATAAAAQAAGFQPVLGWLPTMGVHWVNDARMLTGQHFDLEHPAQLMFSPVGGRDSLVGAAYAYLAADSDRTRPATFDGNPPWHEHPNLAPPGQTLVMLHVWFVPAPDGPFAGHNPLLPFWALGITPPPVERFRDPSAGPPLRRAALALAEIVDSMALFPLLVAREPLKSQLAIRRDSIRALAPLLEAAHHAGDAARWDEVAGRLAAQWERVRADYIAAVANPVRRERVTQFLDEMATGVHGGGEHHH
jgi:hypothetical protein